MQKVTYKLFFLLNNFDWVRDDRFTQYNVHLDSLVSSWSQGLLQVNPPGRKVLGIFQFDLSTSQIGLVAAANLRKQFSRLRPC